MESWRSQNKNVYQGPAGRRTLTPLAREQYKNQKSPSDSATGHHWKIHVWVHELIWGNGRDLGERKVMKEVTIVTVKGTSRKRDELFSHSSYEAARP